MYIQSPILVIPLNYPLNLNKIKAKNSRLGNSISSHKQAGAISNSSNGKAIHLKLGVREVGNKNNNITTNINTLERLNNKQILLVNINKRELGLVKSTNIQGGEAKLNTYKGSTGCTKYIKELKGLKRDNINIKAKTKNHKVLDSNKGKVTHASS